MIVQFMKCSDDKRCLNKSLTNVKTFNKVKLKDDCSMLKPVFILSNKDDVLFSANMVYVPLFSRYYYVGDIVTRSDGLVEVKTDGVDVLTTYKNGIKAVNTIVKRQANKNNAYIEDNMVEPNTKRNIRVEKIGALTKNVNYVITVSGGE